ncbi:hypothetical protein BGZ73_008499 [Actinomortierella ambigua]|nr:hypothetical protein BGZ73_008499 [Actinomortierella ambigua]
MASPRNHPHTPQPVQAPSSIQSAQSFDREWTAQMQVLLTQLGELERKGLLMFHKIEESFKHPYTQSEAMADTTNLLALLDTLMAHTRSTGFGALSMQQLSGATSGTTTGVPGLVSAASTPAGTMTFMSPNSSGMTPRMMQTSLQNTTAAATHPTTNTATLTAAAAASGGDTMMTSPAPFPGSLTSTPAAMIMSPPPGAATAVAVAGNNAATPSAMSTTNTPAATTMGAGPTTPQATAGHTAPTPGESGSAAAATTAPSKVTVAQLIEARQTNVQALYAEKAKLKQHLRAAITMVK